ncbi:hypothetical protein Aperf_G00000039292 [Anoplocephala perfoliata]
MPRPPTVICYICHREYGTASIDIHEKSCLKKWKEQNNKLPPSERLPEPIKPQGFPPIHNASATVDPNSDGFEDNRQIRISGTDPNLEAYNTAASKSSTFSRCSKCGRQFEPENLAIHEAHCKIPPRPTSFHAYEARRPEIEISVLRTPLPHKKSNLSALTELGSGAELVPCKICGRKFAPDRIERHQSNCKATPLPSPSSKSTPSTRRRSTPHSLVHRMSENLRNQFEQTCSNCGAKITDAMSRFCPTCGTPLPPVCALCKRVLPPNAKFCDQCGQPVSV